MSNIKKSIKVLIPDEIIKENEFLNDHYNNGTLSLEFSKELPKESIEKIVKVVEDIQPSELLILLPVVNELNSLQELKSVKELGDLTDESNFKQSVKMRIATEAPVKSFNSKIKKVEVILKKPHKEIIDRIGDIFKIFKEDVVIQKGAIADNFSKTIEEENRRKKEKEDKKKQKEREEIAKLQADNDEKNKKIIQQEEEKKQQKKDSLFNKVKYELITDYFDSIQSDLSNLNIIGVKNRIDSMLPFTFENLISNIDVSIIEEKVDELSNIFKSKKDVCLTNLTNRLNALENEKKLESIKEDPSDKVIVTSTGPLVDSNNNGDIKESIIKDLDLILSTTQQVITNLNSMKIEDNELKELVDILSKNQLTKFAEKQILLKEWFEKNFKEIYSK